MAQPRTPDSHETVGRQQPSLKAETELFIPIDELTGTYQFHDKRYCIGSGAFAEVYKAHHKTHGYVAVKLIKQHIISEDPRAKEMHKKEIQKHAMSLPSDHIVSIKGVIQSGLLYGIVLEFMPNGSLWQFRVDRIKVVPPWPRTVKMIYQIICGMNFLHCRNPPIIHRDLKLKNVLVGKHFNVKIGDFGLATTRSPSSSVSQDPGTVTHKPPEAFSGNPTSVTTKFDMYSFALTVWELLSGEQPYQGHGYHSIADMKRKCQVPGLDRLPEDTPPLINEIIKNGWQKEANERPEFEDILPKCQKLKDDYNDQLDKADRIIKEKLRKTKMMTARPPKSGTGNGGDALDGPVPGPTRDDTPVPSEMQQPDGKGGRQQPNSTPAAAAKPKELFVTDRQVDKLAEKLPGGKYHEFAIQFLDYTEADNILRQKNNYKEAYLEVLQKWKVKEGGRKDELDKKLKGAELGGIVYI